MSLIAAMALHDSAVPDQVFVDEARKAFSGEIIAGRDLLEI